MRHNRFPAKAFFSLLLFFLTAPHAFALGQKQYVETTQHPGDFVLARANHAATLCIDSSDFAGVVRAASDLQADIARVTSITPEISHDASAPPSGCVLIGTLGHSALIDQLVREHKIDVSSISGKWESFLIQVVPHPFPGVSSALVIAGSDKRGAIYGIYDLSEQIGVSPWYWWADVPVPHRAALFIKPRKYIEGEPAVKYRGIFLNDEAPALTGWVKEKFGNYNHEFYTRVFELLLRLKANYLWPAMWNNAFNEDDPLNPKLADEYGIVMGTSHHEPMLRAQQEWKRHGKGPWDYSTNADFLRQFWTEGVERNKSYESITTLGMRGDGDLPMSEESNVALLEKIVADQRKILAEHVNPDLSKIPQDWALYKEVQAYYEKGMRVPDHVTLLWCDDNWGNIRRLPTPEERKRPGGAGIYYHVDYVGDPRSYKWLNTVPIAKIWEQMNLAHAYDANRIWIVNVGDLKPMEFPMEFFLNLARDPQRWPKENLGEYARLWAEREFGPAHAAEIADIVSRYTKFNGRRKPELLEPDTYSVVDYREAESVFNDFQSVVDKAEKIYAQLPANQRDAFFELVLFPAKASAQVTELYITVAKNRLYAAQGRSTANDLAAQAHALFDADASLSAEYNHTLAGGKWDHMMDQTHIGYTFWNEPPKNTMPPVKEIDLPAPAQMAVAVEGSANAWPGSNASPVLPRFDSFRRRREFIDIFNRGRAPFPFFVTPSAPWVVLSSSRGQVTQEQRLWVAIDWTKAPRGSASGSVKISGPAGPDVTVAIDLLNPLEPSRASLNGFVESDGYVSIESVHYSAKVDSPSARWEKIADLGRTLSSMSVFPVTSPSLTPPNSPHLEYRIYLFDPRQVQVEAILAPSLNFVPGRGLRYAISFDDQPPQIIDALAHNSVQDWSVAVEDSVKKSLSTHTLSGSGYHVLKFWMVDPGVVLQKLVLDLGGLKPSYLGPPESFFHL